MSTAQQKEWESIQSSIASLRASVMAVVFGMVGGVGLFVATAWLLVKGGDEVGKNLSLLRHFFPGYSVTWGGAALGLFYGALLGAATGWCLAFVYNMLAGRRQLPG